MNLYIDENRLVGNIRARFPAEAAQTGQWLEERGWNRAAHDDIPHVWVEAFADRIGEAIARKDGAAIREQTAFLADQYLAAPEALRSIVDVSYAENILCNASPKEKAWAWKFIAVDIRRMYVRMWGKPA